MTTAAQSLAQAVRGGLVDTRSTLTGQVSVAAIGASNIVHRVDKADRAVAYVKATGMAAGLDGDDSVARERLVVGLLAGTSIVPTPLSLSTESELWLAPVAGASLADLSFAGDASGITAGFAALGTTLAQLHRTPLPAQAPRLRLPWPLLDHLPPHMDSAKHHAVPTLVIETARSWPDVMAAAAQAWRATAWTHGDVSAMNVILASDGSARLIDWESAGAGDPSWDLAGAQMLAAALLPGQVEIAMARLRHAYRAAGGPAAEPSRALRCVRTLCAAYQVAVGAFTVDRQPDYDGSVTKLLKDAALLADTHRSHHVLP
ncbi:MAG: aminoglycoside phosphotransferase family protein [Micropruina sp.]|nr:aminoglycoside phosphotransferase family protein [Micropruina sp.]